jgi:hypothetical protein
VEVGRVPKPAGLLCTYLYVGLLVVRICEVAYVLMSLVVECKEGGRCVPSGGQCVRVYVWQRWQVVLALPHAKRALGSGSEFCTLRGVLYGAAGSAPLCTVWAPSSNTQACWLAARHGFGLALCSAG